MLTFEKWLDVPARAMMAVLFLLSGISKLTGVAFTQAYMRAFGVPENLLWPAAAFEIICGTLLLVGLWTRPVALLLAGWCILTAFIFHTAFADPIMLMMFLKNVTIAGAFLLLMRTGAVGFSVDGLQASRVSRTVERPPVAVAP